MDTAYEHVREFHRTFQHGCPDKPTALDLATRERRAKFIREECDELVEADSLVDQVDACMDIIYFALGTLASMCIKPMKLFLIVHAANMRKLWPDGKPRWREGDRKVIKPEGWYGPEAEMQIEIDRQIEEANLRQRLDSLAMKEAA